MKKSKVTDEFAKRFNSDLLRHLQDDEHFRRKLYAIWRDRLMNYRSEVLENAPERIRRSAYNQIEGVEFVIRAFGIPDISSLIEQFEDEYDS